MTVTSQIKRLSKDTFFYGMGSALQGLIGFLLFPIYTRVLTMDEVGVQDLILTATTIITYLLMLGLDSSAGRFFYDSQEEDHHTNVLSTWLWSGLGIMLPICLLVIIFAEPFCKAIFNQSGLGMLLSIGVATIPVTFTSRVITLTLRLTYQPKKYAFLISIDALMQAGAAILYVVVWKMGVMGVFLGLLTARSVMVIAGLILTHRHYKTVFSFSLLKSMLVFGVPLVPSVLSQWILNYSNRYFLTRMVSNDEIAILGTATKVTMVITLIITAFNNAWPPFAYSILSQPELAKKTYARTLTYFLLVALLAGTGLAIFGREAVIILAGSKYEPVYHLLPWLFASTIGWGVMNITILGVEIAKKSYHITIATVLGAIVTIGLNALLIPRYGLMGAVISMPPGSIVTLIYSHFAGQHYFKIPYEVKKIIPLLVLSILAVIAAQMIDGLFPHWSIILAGLKGALSIIWIGLVFSLRIIAPNDIRSMVDMIRGKLPFLQKNSLS